MWKIPPHKFTQPAIWLLFGCFFFRATIAPIVHTYSQNDSDKGQSNYCIAPTKRWQEKDVQCFIVFALIIGCWPWNLIVCNWTLIATQKRWLVDESTKYKQLLRLAILFYHNFCVSAQARLVWKLLAIVCTKNPCHWWHLALSCAVILRAVSFLADYVATFNQLIGMKLCSCNEITKQSLKVAKD